VVKDGLFITFSTSLKVGKILYYTEFIMSFSPWQMLPIPAVPLCKMWCKRCIFSNGEKMEFTMKRPPFVSILQPVKADS
jgi:hypothetical protein